MDGKRLLDGLAALEGVILPSTPQFSKEEARRTLSDHSMLSADGAAKYPAYQQQRGSVSTVGRPSMTDQCPLTAIGSMPPQAGLGPTLAFFLQLQPPPPDGLVTAVLPPQAPHLSSSWLARLSACAEPAQRLVLPPSPPPRADGSAGSVQVAASAVNPRALRNALLLLTFNSGAATMTALAKLQAAASATQGRAALAALQPVPLVARVFGEAVAAADAAGTEQAAVVLLALLSQAGLPLPDDLARTLVIPTAVRLLGGSGAATAVADAAATAAAAAATASGTLSSSNLHLRLQPPQEVSFSYPHYTSQFLSAGAAGGAAAAAAASFAAAPPASCRLAAARLLLHLATSAPNAVPIAPSGGAPSPGPGAVRDCLVAVGALEACAAALCASVASSPELLLCTLRLLSALTADVAGWPWEWPVVRAAAVEGCARHAVALMQLLAGEESEGPADVQAGFRNSATGVGEEAGGGSDAALAAATHAAARDVVANLARGPLLVREALVRAGGLSPVAEAIMMWPPPGAAMIPCTAQPGAATLTAAGQGQSPFAGPGGPSRRHFALCLGVLLSLSALPGVRVALGSPALAPLLGHLLDLLESPQLSGPHEGPRRASGTQLGGGAQQKQQQGAASSSPEAAAEVRGPLLELLLNLALDLRCHLALAEQQIGARLVRCVASASAAQPLRLEPASAAAAATQAGQGTAPWRAAAALRLLAALAADGRFTAARPAMQSELAAAGAVEAVAEEVQRTIATLHTTGCAAQYELALAALCALMTGNVGVQRQVAATAGLLTSLAAALAHPVVMKSNARLRVTLAAWRLITAPLAAPSAAGDPSVAADLLIGLGHDPGVAMMSPAVSGPIDQLFGDDPLYGMSESPKAHPLARRSILQAAADAVIDSGSTGGDPVQSGNGGNRRASNEREDVEAGEQRAGPRHNTSLKSAATGAGAAATAGSTAAASAVWAGLLLPNTALPPPGTLPPDIAPLRMPSRVIATQPSVRNRERGDISPVTPSFVTGGAGPAAAAAAAAAPKEELSGPATVSVTSPGRSAPHLSVFASSGAEDDGDASGGIGSSQGSRTSISLAAALLRPTASQHQQQPPPPDAVQPPLPGALILEDDGAAGGTAESAPAASEAELRQTPSQILRTRDPSSPRRPAAVRHHHGPHSNSGAATAATAPPPPFSFQTFPSTTSRDIGATDTPAKVTSVTSLAAAAAVPPPVLEMAPPLMCLVKHLQALLPRPGCRAGAALVLVQLARLEVVRSSAVMAACWGSLMLAVTSSLTGGPLSASTRAANGGAGGASGGGAERWAPQASGLHSQPSQRQEPPLHTLSGTSEASSAAAFAADPRDKLALLEAMEVAAGTAAEGRAALTHGSVVTALAELACGRGALAESLLLHEGGLSHPYQLCCYNQCQHTDHDSNSHHRSLQHHLSHNGRFTHFSHQQHHHHYHGQPHHSSQQQQRQHQYQQQQRYLPRARMLAMAILSELVAQPFVSSQLQADSMGSVLAENLLQSLSAAVASATAAAPPPASGPSMPWGPEEQQRLRNAAARLLRQLAEHVGCARELLALPRSVDMLTDILSQLWDVHGPSLAPPTVAPGLPRAPPALGNRGRALTLRNPMLDSGASFVLNTRGGDSFHHAATTTGVVLTSAPSGRTFAAAQASPLPSSMGGGSGHIPSPLPAAVAATTGTAGAAAAASSGSFGLSNNPFTRTITGQGLSAAAPRPSGTGYQQQRVFPMSPAVFGGPGQQHSTDSPHGVTTRMSLHTSACPDVAQWTTPAQQAMKALELTEERNAAAAASTTPVRHASTHAGFLQPRSLAGTSLLGGSSNGGSGSGATRTSRSVMRGPSRLSAAAAAAMAADEDDDEEDPLLRGITPPGQLQQQQQGRSLSQHLSLMKRIESTSAGGAGAGAGAGVGGGSGADPAALLDSANGNSSFSELMVEGGTAAAGVAAGRGKPLGGAETHAVEAGGSGGGAERSDVQLPDGKRPMARRGTRSLAPAVPAVAAPPASAPAAAAAAQCAVQLAELLSVLAASDADAARAMATLPSVELFVDLLAASHAAVVRAALELLAALAARQDAHETFWDCDVVGQVVAHLQLRSAAAEAAASGNGGASAAAAAATATGAAEAGVEVVQQLQLRAAQVLERLCCDPDLHGRLAATELPAALMAVVRRATMPDAAQQATDPMRTSGGLGGWSSMPPMSFGSFSGAAVASAAQSPSLLVCVLSALGSLLGCEDVRRQARERRFPLYLGMLAGGGAAAVAGGVDPLVSELAAQCGEKLRDGGVQGVGGVRFRAASTSSVPQAP